ncbi:hypothetical protein M433DRAFT_130228 [Acidomyces richmondensis BFW]|nr:MAG: hypothetical protein FE78DRAFT_148703 [Acidomyces sp. 'richmondensis']KYG50578.1 hypothetical protein M433DRAFT_130228 [Acidomyces richmondensis BFW]
MSQKESKEEHSAKLLQMVDEAQRANDPAKAASILAIASQIYPENPEIRSRWLALQRQDGEDTLQTIREYMGTGKDATGQKAILSLRQRQLSSAEASEAYNLLLAADDSRSLLDDITAALFAYQVEARKLVCQQLQTNATEVFQALFRHGGDETFRQFASIALDDSLWVSKDAQKTAQQDVFRLCIATLMEAGVERPERLMRALSCQLAFQPNNVADLIDADVVDVMLCDLDIRLDSNLRSQAIVSTSKLLQATKERGEQLLASFITGKVSKQTNDDLIVAFSAAAAVFPILPGLMSKLFMTDGFVQQLVPRLEKNSEAAAHGKRKSRTLEQAALEMMSAACIEKTCREAIKRYCSHWLIDLSNECEGVHKALATLVLAKSSDQYVAGATEKLSNLALKGDAELDQAIEGLAYTSLQPTIKEEICENSTLLTKICTTLKERKSAAFGCLTIISNLTAYLPSQTEEQKKIAHLKAYADSSKLAPDDPLDNDQHVSARCKKILDHGIVPSLVAACKQTTSRSNIALAARILRNLAREQQHRAKMVQQGAIRLLLQIHDRAASFEEASREATLIQREASHALARLLISVNPTHVFTSSLPSTSAVRALLSVLDHESDVTEQQRDFLPVFEAMLALTNLASMEEATARDLIIRTAFDKIEDLLFSTIAMIQRASVELICNLMASPNCVAKFADGTKDSKRRLQILLALTDTEDVATRRAAGGALAMLTEWDAAIPAVLDAVDGKGVKAVLRMCEDENEEVLHRGFVCALNLVSNPDEIGKRGVVMVRDAGGLERLTDMLKKTTNEQILQIGAEVLKKIR